MTTNDRRHRGAGWWVRPAAGIGLLLLPLGPVVARNADGASAADVGGIARATVAREPGDLSPGDIGLPTISTPPLADSAAVTAFLAAVRGVDPVVCDLAVRSVDGNFGWGGGDTPASATARDERARAIVRAVTRGLTDAAVVPPLRTALGDADACVRRMAAPLLGRADAPGAFAALLEALRAPDAGTREMAALGLGFADSSSAVAPLVGTLRDESPLVRAMSAWALGRIEDPTAIEPLVRALREDADPVVRRSAAWALGEIE